MFTTVPLVQVVRGSHLDAVFRGAIAVVDTHGRLIASAGDPSLTTLDVRARALPDTLFVGGTIELVGQGASPAVQVKIYGSSPKGGETLLATSEVGTVGAWRLMVPYPGGKSAPRSLSLRVVLLQGGTQKNLAAVKAQVDYLRARLELRHQHLGVRDDLLHETG